MKKLKVYIVDSSVLLRQSIAAIISKMPDATILGNLNSGSSKEIIRQIKENEPDVVVMGVSSVDSHESEVFLNLRENFPFLPVIVITPRTQIGAKTTLFALKHGAVEFVTIPSKSCNLLLAQRHLDKRLVPAIRMIPRLNLHLLSDTKNEKQSSAALHQKTDDPIRKRMNGAIELVVVGGCTGGIQSLYTLIANLSQNLTVPVIIVQHMPRIFTKVLAEELDEITPLHVREATSNSLLVPGQIYLAPGGYHTSIRNNGTRKQITLHRGPKEHKCRPSIDVLLRSARYIYENRILAVYLSGGGKDGLLGAREIANAGGQIILQDKESSLLWDLPSKIYEEGLAAGVNNLKELNDEIIRRTSPAMDETRSLQNQSSRLMHSTSKSTNGFDSISL